MLEIIRRGLNLMRSLLRGTDFPEDPYASVRQPRVRTPGGRSSSVAVEEPRELAHVEADSGARSRHP